MVVRLRTMVPRAFSALVGAVLGLAACTGAGQMFPGFSDGAGGGAGGAGGGVGGAGVGLGIGGSQGPPPADAGGLCGNEIHPVLSQPTNVYFIFDISGSMSTPVPGGTRFSLVQSAAATLVDTLRYVITPGAAAFPLQTSAAEPCHIGGEVYPPFYDDPVGFDMATLGLSPSGGTPTAATLTALQPRLAGLAGKTIAVLATDGGPNCNASAACTAATCTENIEGCDPGDTCCAMGTNCCAPSGPAGPLNCVDEAATVAAVAALAAAGVEVYVIGIPGSQFYSGVLSQMAFAGGAAQAASPFYYDVQDLTTLGAVLLSIAGSSVSCDITIADPPATPGDTNVYLDQQLVLSDPVNGWTWTAADVVTLHGTACQELRSGQVAQVQVVSGCPTQATQ